MKPLFWSYFSTADSADRDPLEPTFQLHFGGSSLQHHLGHSSFRHHYSFLAYSKILLRSDADGAVLYTTFKLAEAMSNAMGPLHNLADNDSADYIFEELCSYYETLEINAWIRAFNSRMY